MIKTICHFSDLHLKLLKDHDLYRTILSNMLEQFKELNPCRIVFTGDMVHSKNSVSPELIEMVSWILLECSKITKTIIIPGNHDFISNLERLDTLSPIINNLNNSNVVYYRDRGVYEDKNVSWCVYSQFQGNVPPEICDSKGIKIGLFLMLCIIETEGFMKTKMYLGVFIHNFKGTFPQKYVTVKELK